jgi:hypothetical protein
MEIDCASIFFISGQIVIPSGLWEDDHLKLIQQAIHPKVQTDR